MPIARFVKQRRVRRGAWNKTRFSIQRRNWRGSTKAAATPTVSSIAPSTAVAGGPNLTVTLTGTGFVNGTTKATVNGGAVATTFINTTSISCVVPATMMLSAIVLQIGAITGQLAAPVTRPLTITAE